MEHQDNEAKRRAEVAKAIKESYGLFVRKPPPTPASPHGTLLTWRERSS